MNVTKTTRAVLLSAMVAAVATVPTVGAAEGHSGDFAGNKGYVGEKGYVGNVRRVHHGHHHTRMVRKRTHAQSADATLCPHNFFGMYRGTMFCKAGKVLR